MRARRTCRTRGTAMVLIVILSVLITGLVMSLAMAAGVQSQITGNMTRVDAAFYAAEAGAQRAAWYIKNNKTVAQPLTGTINGSSYSVTWTAAGTAFRVTSAGACGSASNTVLMTVTPPVTAPRAAISIANSLTLKNLTINGNTIVGQDVTFQPGTAEINGDLTYGTNLNGNADVSGTKTKAAFSGVNWTTLHTTLTNAAQATYSGTQTNRLFDFNALSGTNKVIYINGNVTNPSFNGTGTLYVNGSVTFTGDVGTAAKPVNVVATGEIATANNSSYYGALYAKTNWNRGKIDLTGTVYIHGSMNLSNNNGQSSITFTSTPWFDNRTASGGGSGASSMTFSSFAGPRP